MDDDVFAHVRQDLILNDLPPNNSLYPRVIFGFIPAECFTHDLTAHAFTEINFDTTPVWDIECCYRTVFKITVDSSGFHEEHVVALDPGQHYSLAALMGGAPITLSGLQQIYRTYHEVVCRNFPKRPYA